MSKRNDRRRSKHWWQKLNILTLLPQSLQRWEWECVPFYGLPGQSIRLCPSPGTFQPIPTHSTLFRVFFGVLPFPAKQARSLAFLVLCLSKSLSCQTLPALWVCVRVCVQGYLWLCGFINKGATLTGHQLAKATGLALDWAIFGPA